MASLCSTVLRQGATVVCRHGCPSSSWQPTRLLSVVHGDLSRLAPRVRRYVEENARLFGAASVHVCDGSDAENSRLLAALQQAGVVKPLPKLDNCWLTRTDPADVARVESRTVISTTRREDTIPTPKEGVKGLLGNWMSPEEIETQFNDRYPGCMKGRTMYVVPFSMGPIGSPLSKIGIQLTDSAYVVASMRIMTRMGERVLETLADDAFVKCLHSVGRPLPSSVPEVSNWPCNPEKTIIAHIPDTNTIASFGSGYGGNSLMGKKCFALRIGSILARKEGWLAEHMLILGITNPAGEKRYVAAAFPSACGKTNLAMLTPTIPGFKVECVGDDICWMKFDEEGRLRAINPEAGFFGVAPGTSMETNPNAMRTIQSNTIYTNVAETSDGGYYWEGLEGEVDTSRVDVTSWLGQPWTAGSGKPAAHPNSRFCTPASQCPIIDPDWESPRGVPIDAILFGGRRPEGVPLVYEAFDWKHGVFVGATMRSESTAAAEHKGKAIMHDPFAMRPFFGYNFGDYLSHWLSMEGRTEGTMPRIFHVNWFRRDAATGRFLWPGFGDNCRVLDWVCRRVAGGEGARKTAVGYVPLEGALNLEGLGAGAAADTEALFDVSREFWLQEVADIQRYFDEQLPTDTPDEMRRQLAQLLQRVQAMK